MCYQLARSIALAAMGRLCLANPNRAIQFHEAGFRLSTGPGRRTRMVRSLFGGREPADLLKRGGKANGRRNGRY